MGSINIGQGVQLAPNCALYSYNHCFEPHKPIREQPLHTKGGINIGDEAWLGVGAIVLDGVRIGKGAVIAAGSIVTQDVPDSAVAAGVPAHVVKMRSDII
jgi:acetyltransferase-like isoleucine patch superfamily enzyme